ncbi:RPA-related protein RADX [Lacerta agilis]|uniref:RPA-related protein RADX n=1 Tax=Lacerta agilis TaxID=80427 RepID=UPI0014197D3C|nr:RPA-related protein RADX [Lacerta agilis]
MGSHASERPTARGEEADMLELWLDSNPYQRRKRWRNMGNETGRDSWIQTACCRAIWVSNQVLTFAAPQPVTVLSLERYLKDTTKKTRASYFSVSRVSTRTSSSREVTTPDPSATPGPSTSQATTSAGATNEAPSPNFSTSEERTRASSLTKVPKRTGFQYFYDVTISDGVYRERCFLAPELSRLVHTNALRCGLRVKITEASCAFFKKINSWVMCIEQIEVVGAASRFDAALGLELPEYMMKSHMPLTGSWKYYLPLWNNEDPYGDIWLEKKASQNDLVDDSAIKTLHDLQKEFGHKIGNKIKIGTHPIIIKITHKGRLQYYGKSTLAVDKPYQASFRVADHTGSMAMVLWNDLCCEWYNSLEVGTVLFLENYGVKRSHPFKTQPTLGAIGMKKSFSIELTVKCGQRPTLIVIPNGDIKSRWRLPKLNFRFVTRSKLPVTPYIDDCDVVGLVKFVGRTERTRTTEHREDFLIHRWVMVADGTSDQTFILQLFSSSQPDIFEKIHPMSHLVCTHMKVIRQIAENGSTTSYLQTTDQSQMFISEWHKGQPYEKEARVKSIAQWMRTQEEHSHLKETSIGGYYPLPPAPDTFLKYCKTASVEQVLKTVDEIGEEIEKLHYREHKRIAIQGIIGAIKYIDCTKISSDASVGTPEQVSQEPAAGTSAQTSLSPEQQPTEPRKCRAKRKNRTVGSDEDEQDASAAETSAPVRKKRRRTRRASKKKHPKCPPGSWENSFWAGIKDSLEQHLHCSSVFQESFPSKFNYEKSDFLMQLYNLQASKYKDVPTAEAQTEYACPYEYYQVTIVGLDYDTAIDVALLPVCYSENSDLLQAAGMHCSTLELPHTSSQQKTARGLSRGGLRRKPLICILDVCSLGEDKVEVFLNKVYVAEE